MSGNARGGNDKLISGTSCDQYALNLFYGDALIWTWP